MKRVKIKDILKEFQEGVDFTIESKEKVFFHNEKIVNYLERQGEAKWFYDFIRRFIPSAVCFYEEKENGNCVFTFKSGNNKKDSNQEIEKKFKENTGIDITHCGKNSNGERVISRKFKNSEVERQKNELIEENMKENKNQVDKSGGNLNRRFIDNGNSLTYSTEKTSKNEVIRETYNEEKQIIEQSKVRREKEAEEKQKSQTEISENNSVKAENSIQSDKNQELSKDKDHKFPTGWIVGGGIMVVVVLIAAVGINLKGKKRK